MSKHKNNIPSPEERRRMVDHALKDFYVDHAPKQPTTEVGKLILRGSEASYLVKNQITTVLSAAEEAGHAFDYAMAEATVNTLFLDAFSKWNKDDLLQLLCALQSGMLMLAVKDAHEQGIF
jgi:hypothetical protein